MTKLEAFNLAYQLHVDNQADFDKLNITDILATADLIYNWANRTT
jgi:hypothetical protein